MAMAREAAFFVESFTGTITAGNPITVVVTPSFPDSCDRYHFIAIGVCDPLAVDTTIASVTVGGQAATLIQNLADSVGNTFALYGYKQPPRAAHNVVVTFNNNVNAFVIVNSFEQIDPQDGVGVLDATTGTTGASDTRTLTSSDLATSLAVQCACLFGGATNVTLTPVSPFSSSGTGQVGASPFRFRVAASVVGTPPGGASASARYNFSTNPKPWAHIAVEVKAARLQPMCSQLGMGF